MTTTPTLTSASQSEIARFMEGLIARNPGEPEFHQAVHEVVASLMPVVLERQDYQDAQILQRLTEPDRVIQFRVTWEDDRGGIHVNRAFRVQFNNTIGPYKGGLRFHPTVNLGVLKFLAFEQCFKNALTTLPLGGGKGGSDFDPKGRSDREVMRFCQAFMTELHRHIGEDTDVPAGDIGVGVREIGYLFGQYKRLENRFTGMITGKGLAFGGSLVRTEATGHGAVYFTEDMLAERGEGLAGKTAAVSGSGNVAIYCIEKLIELGARVVTASDSSGFIHDPAGIDLQKLAWLKDLKEARRGRINEYAEHFRGTEFFAGQRPWGVPCELAFPCATQNELDEDDARLLVTNGIQAVAEGANMPTTMAADQVFHDARVLFAPGKAANAGGVAVSGLEQAQNAQRVAWTREAVDDALRRIMADIHDQCRRHGQEEDGFVNYVKGANLAAFEKIADAMIACGIS